MNKSLITFLFLYLVIGFSYLVFYNFILKDNIFEFGSILITATFFTGMGYIWWIMRRQSKNN